MTSTAEDAKGGEDAPMICDECRAGPLAPRSFRRLVDGEDPEFVYHTTLNQVQSGVALGCGLCRLLWTRMSPKYENRLPDVSFKLSFRAPGSESLSPQGVQSLCIAGRAGFGHHYIYTDEDDPSATEVVARPPILAVGSKQAYDLAREALAICIEFHEHCPKPGHRTQLPTRVIDCADPSQPRLFISNGLCIPYVALSYVWGGPQTYCTTRANMNSYVDGIHTCYIPQTIRDAIAVTNRLGLRYLWVDALCIIQDSDEDKVRELVKMRQIYRDAYLTVIASNAPAANAGFLQTRVLPHEYTEHPQLPFYCRDGRVGRIHVFFKDSYKGHESTKEPINQRAWCLQEWLLSPRKLVYTTHTIQYHCQVSFADLGNAITLKSNEQLSDVMFASPDNGPDPGGAGDPGAPAVLETWTPDDWARLHETWRRIVANYTRRALTNESDKLHAFAGVAEQFQRVWRARAGRYLAGVWEHFLPNDLLWGRVSRLSDSPSAADRPLRPRLTQSSAPSWSWASVDGEVHAAYSYDYMDRSENDYTTCEVLRCELELEDEALPYGHVVAASLWLRAVAVPTPWMVPPEADMPVKLYIPTDLLRSRLEEAHSGKEIVVGRQSDSEDPNGVHSVVLGKHQIYGKVVAFDRRMEEDSSLLTHVGDVAVIFDGMERVDASTTVAVVVGRARQYADGLLVTDVGSGKFRRIGYWNSAPSWEGVDSDFDGPHWFEVNGSGSATEIIELV